MNMIFPDLHVHLYGSLTLDDLYYLHSRNTPRWDIFRNSYQKTYAAVPEIENLFRREDTWKKRLGEYYFFLNPGNFQKFQTSFDLVIALSSTEPEELQEIVRRVSSRSAGYCEMRMMFSPFISDQSFSERVLAICEEMNAENSRRSGKYPIRLAMSLDREGEGYRRKYEILKKLQSSSESVREELTAIDFCAKEEGFPPKEKQDFVKNVLRDNREKPENALAVLYHVGESFVDKSIESAARWVLQASEMGCHRLGHAVALGINPDFYSGKKRKEIAEERIDHIKFILENFQELQEAGYEAEKMDLEKELNHLESNKQKETEIIYNSIEVKNAGIFQNWAMSKIKESGTVIEVCPTSNIRIANLGKASELPVWRFMKFGLKIVLGSDDPGILKTDISEEYSLIDIELKKKNLKYKFQNLYETAETSVSEILSGRKP